MLQKFKVMAGISNDDPPDSKWISLEKTDKKTGKKVRVEREQEGWLFRGVSEPTLRQDGGAGPANENRPASQAG